MAYIPESKEEAVRRVRREFDSYAPSVLLNELETAAVSGNSPHSLKAWRLSQSGKGPDATYLNGQVKYTVGSIRDWFTRSAILANQNHHAPQPPALASGIPASSGSCVKNLTHVSSAKKPDLVVACEAPKRTPIPGPKPKRRTREREIA